MKKLVLMFVAIAAVSFASCGNKAADAEKATADSIRIADSIAAVEAAAAEAAAQAAVWRHCLLPSGRVCFEERGEVRTQKKSVRALARQTFNSL